MWAHTARSLPKQLLDRIGKLDPAIQELADILATVFYCEKTVEHVATVESSRLDASGKDCLLRECRLFVIRQKADVRGPASRGCAFATDLAILMKWLAEPGYIYAHTPVKLIAYTSDTILRANGWRTALSEDEWADCIGVFTYTVGIVDHYVRCISAKWQETGQKDASVFDGIHKCLAGTTDYVRLLKRLANLPTP